MIYAINYFRWINGTRHAKTATFITKETNERLIYMRWIKNHSMEFIKNVKLVSIAKKYPTTKDIQLDRMSGDITDKQADDLISKRDRLGMFTDHPSYHENE